MKKWTFDDNVYLATVQMSNDMCMHVCWETSNLNIQSFLEFLAALLNLTSKSHKKTHVKL